MTDITFTFSLSDKYINEQFIEAGVTPNKYDKVTIRASHLTKEARKAYVEMGGGKAIEIIELGTFDSPPSEESISTALVNLLDKKKEKIKEQIDEAIAYIQKLEAMDDKAIAAHDVCFSEEGTLKKVHPDWAERLEAQRQRSRDTSVAIREAKEAAEKAAKEAAEQEKLNWINAHGSEHLKKAIAAGYNCKRMYITERATLEYPDFQVDIDNAADWKSRSCPSPTALEFSLQVSGSEVVWCTRPHDYKKSASPYDYEEDDEEDDFEPQEAVVICNYLGEDLNLIYYVK